MRLDLVDLRLFLAVVEGGSITAGARRVNLALASASQRVRGMEEDLGVGLLERGRHGVRPTPAGEALAERARVVLAAMERLESELAVFARGLRGRVRLVANTAAFGSHLPETLACFLAAHPALDLDIEELDSAGVVRAVASGRADLGIAREEEVPAELASLPFGCDRLVALLPASHRLASAAASRQLAFAELLDEDFVGLAHASALQRHLAGRAAKLGRTLRMRARVMDFDALCRLVEAGVGLAILPEAAALRWREDAAAGPGGTTQVRALADPWATRRLRLCYGGETALSGPARLVLDHLRRAASPGGV